MYCSKCTNFEFSRRSLVRQLTLEVGGAIFTNLEQFLKSNRGISQNQALQFIFDAKFLNLLIGGNTETKDEVRGLSCLISVFRICVGQYYSMY